MASHVEKQRRRSHKYWHQTPTGGNGHQAKYKQQQCGAAWISGNRVHAVSTSIVCMHARMPAERRRFVDICRPCNALSMQNVICRIIWCSSYASPCGVRLVPTLPYVMLSVHPLDIHWIAVAAYIANNFTRTCAARADPHWQICVHTMLFISFHRRYGHISRIEQTNEHENARACARICRCCSRDCVAFQTISVHEIVASLIVGFAFT